MRSAAPALMPIFRSQHQARLLRANTSNRASAALTQLLELTFGPVSVVQEEFAIPGAERRARLRVLARALLRRRHHRERHHCAGCRAMTRWAVGDAEIEQLLAGETTSTEEAHEAIAAAQQLYDAASRLLPTLGFF